MNDGTCIEDEQSNITKALIITSQVMAGTGILGAAIVALMTFSSPIAIWLIVNQIQLISLLVLTGAYMPLAAKEILIGSLYTSFSFAKIPVIDIPGINIPLKELDIEQENENLKLMGLNSSSSFTFNSTYLIIIIILVLFHLLTLLTPQLEDRHLES